MRPFVCKGLPVMESLHKLLAPAGRKPCCWQSDSETSGPWNNQCELKMQGASYTL